MSTNPHRGSDFTEFLTQEGLMPTPRTDAMRLKMAQLGWPSDGEPVAMLMASHGELERELAVWKHEVDLLRAELKKFDEQAISWWCEYQELRQRNP